MINIKRKDYFLLDYLFRKDDILTNDCKSFINIPIILNEKAIGVITDTKIDGGYLTLKCLFWKKYCNELQLNHSQTIEWIILGENYIEPNAIIINQSK